MAFLRTFPSRDALPRLRFRPWDVVVGAGIFLLIYIAVRVGATAHAPIPRGQAPADAVSTFARQHHITEMLPARDTRAQAGRRPVLRDLVRGTGHAEVHLLPAADPQRPPAPKYAAAAAGQPA